MVKRSLLRQNRRGRRFRVRQDFGNAECRELLHGVWRLDWEYNPTCSGVPPDTYLQHWGNCVFAANDPDLLLEDRGVTIGLTTMLRNNINEPSDDIKKLIRYQYTTTPLKDDQVLTAFKFVTALWLHCSPDFTLSSVTFRDAVATCLPMETPPYLISGFLSYDFCIKHLCRKAGFYIHWTDEIEQHLSLDRDIIKVFRNSSMLSALQREPKSDPFPTGFVHETLQTLHLLFRPLQPTKRQWNIRYMEKHCNADLEFAMGNCEVANFNLKQYLYWHERLALIQAAYDKKTPSTIRQWWYNRRDRIQWATFWVAFVVFILTVVFGVVSSVTGIMQVYAAYHVV